MRSTCVLLLSATIVFSQTLVERTYLVRTETDNMDRYAGLTRVCVLVYPDGKYRLERSFQNLQGAKPETRIYLGQLPFTDVMQLQSALDDPNFQAIKTTGTMAATGPSTGGSADWPLQLMTGSHGSMNEDADVLRVVVPRQDQLQDIKFENAKQREPYKKTLTPLLSWMKDIEKRRVPRAKEEAADNCRPPQVLYKRSSTPPTSKPEAADKAVK